MDRCTHEVRTQYWKEIIQACQERPEGQSAKQWLKDNGILEQSYYKWQQKFRKEAYCYSPFYMPLIFSFSSKLKEGTE